MLGVSLHDKMGNTDNPLRTKSPLEEKRSRGAIRNSSEAALPVGGHRENCEKLIDTSGDLWFTVAF